MKLPLDRQQESSCFGKRTALRAGKRLAASLFLLILAASVATRATAGTWPNLLDDNRSGLYGPAAQALIQLLAPFACPPVFCKVQAGGRVVPHPKIVNLYWDDNWDAHNPGSPTRAEINARVQLLTASEYLDGASQYGVGRGNFHSEHGSSTLCQTMRPTAPNGQAASHTNPGTMNLSALVGWFSCEVENSLFTGVPLPDNDTIYSVILPEGVTITGQPGATCSPTAAFHIFSALFLPNTDPDVLLGITLKLVAVPIIVMPAECMLAPTHSGTVDNFTKLFSHELIEAALDPVPPTGWIDNSLSSDLVKWTNEGEPGDICQPSSMYLDVITSVVRLPFGVLVERYWSNAKGECVPTGDTTPPIVTPMVTGTHGLGGWYVSDVTVGWDPKDEESRVSSKLGCGVTTINTNTAGTTPQCVATSAGGTATGSVTIKRDATLPTIGHVTNPEAPDGANLWYVNAPTLTFACSDSFSGLASCLADGSAGSSASATLGEAAFAQSVAGTATDNAGNASHDAVSGLLVDLSDPEIITKTNRRANADGWWNAPVVVSFKCVDFASGVATCPAATSFAEGFDQSAAGTVTDHAGRSAYTSLPHINIDTTAPVISYSGNAGIYGGSQTVSISCTASDARSGIASTTCADASGLASSFGLGTTTLSASATDLAGNIGTGSTSFTVVATPPEVGPIVNPANGHSYYLLAPATWADAESEAVTLGGHLVTVGDANENTWVWETFAPSSFGPVWIGLGDAAQEGTFVWTSGEPAAYLNWWTAGGQPSNDGGIENYVEMNNYVWNDNTGIAILHGVVEVVPEPAVAGAWAALATIALVWRRRCFNA